MTFFLKRLVLLFTLTGSIGDQIFNFLISPMTLHVSGNSLLRPHTSVFNAVQCARLCHKTWKCDHLQHCEHNNSCVLYETCANCTRTYFNNCRLTVVLTGSFSTVAEPLACGDHKYLVSGPYGVGDDQLSESSYYLGTVAGTFVCPQGRSGTFARRNSTNPCSSWSPASDDPNDYVQVDFGAVKLTTGVVLAGRINDPVIEPQTNQYVTGFKLLYSVDCVTFTPKIDGEGNEQIFEGCSSADDVVTHCFYALLPARCIRINPTSYVGWKSMRFDILGY